MIRTRELEDPNGRHSEIYQKEDVSEDANDFPFKRLQAFYKPDELCGSLTENQLAVFNIPLSADEQDVEQFVRSRGVAASKVSITRCVLGLNSFATVTVEPSGRAQAAQQLHRARFNGCVLEVRSREDAESENAWNRTLVLTNFNRTLSLTVGGLWECLLSD